MAKSVLDTARKYLQNKKFSDVIKLLEPRVLEYRDSFQFYYILGVACLYQGDVAGSETYFKSARHIKLNDVNLILAQAVIFLKRGKIDKAVEYCLDALNLEPENPKTQRFLKLLEKYGDVDTISEWNHNGKLKVFYPELPKKSPIKPILISLACVCAVLALVFLLTRGVKLNNRADLSSFSLSFQDKSDLTENSTASTVYRYILTQSEVENYYEDAKRFYNQYNDNEAQRCINILLNSNASASIRQKARQLMEYLEEPVFDSKFEQYTYQEISKDLYLYQDCWVVWTGRVTNVNANEKYFSADLLVGYEDMKKIDGIAPLKISSEISVNPEKPLKVLAQISIEDGRLLLLGKAVYQPLTGDKL
jgi:tetratricopeptide (TPR) repeat protein